MIVRIEPVELDPIMMLLHECNSHLARNPFEDRILAEALNKALEEIAGSEFMYVRMVPPADNGLSRWTLEWNGWNDEPQRFVAHRGITKPREVRAALPKSVVAALRTLSDRTITLDNS